MGDAGRGSVHAVTGGPVADGVDVALKERARHGVHPRVDSPGKIDHDGPAVAVEAASAMVSKAVELSESGGR